jgi:hypothetical protein
MAKPYNSGQSGNVFYPSLDCMKPDKGPKGNYVSKLMTEVSAENELRGSRLAKGQSWAVLPEYTCKWNGRGVNSLDPKYNTLLFSKYSGITMDKISSEVWMKPDTLKAYFRLIDNVLEWNKICYHGDITEKNTLWDGSNFHLIDFERAVCSKGNNSENYKKMNDEMKFNDNLFLYLNLYESLGPETRKYYNISKVEDIIALKLGMRGGAKSMTIKKKNLHSVKRKVLTTRKKLNITGAIKNLNMNKNINDPIAYLEKSVDFFDKITRMYESTNDINNLSIVASIISESVASSLKKHEASFQSEMDELADLFGFMKTVNFSSSSSKNVSFDSIYRKLMNEEKAISEPFEYIEDLHDSIEIILNQYNKKYNTIKRNNSLTKYEMFIVELSDNIQEAIQLSEDILNKKIVEEKSANIDELASLMNSVFSKGFGK